MTVLSILIFVLILGVLITIHEFGHYFAAKKCGIRVNEFAIGMGPKIWKKQKGETLYSLRAFPIGGFCAMGEDEEAEKNDPHAFPNAKIRYRALVLAAGSIMNFLLGFVLLLAFHLTIPANTTPFQEPVVVSTAEGFDFAGANGFLPGDRIVEINGYRIYNTTDVHLFLRLGERNPPEPYNFVLRRGEETITLKDLPLVTKEYPNNAGEMEKRFGLNFGIVAEDNLGVRLRNACVGTVNNVRLVWVSLGELIGGRAGVDDLTGPVGMGSMVDGIVKAPGLSTGNKALSLLDFSALIAINLALMNLLPLPALDGGRLLFLLVEAIRRKPANAKVEGYIHMAGFMLFIGLMIFVFFNDIMRLIGMKGV